MFNSYRQSCVHVFTGKKLCVCIHKKKAVCMYSQEEGAYGVYCYYLTELFFVQ